MASLNEESVEKKLKTVNNTQDSIQSLSLWIIHHKTNHAKIVQLWLKVLKRSVHPSHRLTLLYLCNDVVQTCKKKKAQVYATTFREHLPEAARLVRDISVKGKVERIFNIWQERGVYDAAFVTSLNAVLNGKPWKAPVVKPNVNDPISPAASPYEPGIKETTPEIQAVPEPPAEDDIDESTRILAEFKPHEMIEQITAFRRQELEIQLKSKQITHLRLDASSLEAVKQLKDRAHGNEFSSQFEDSCTKLEVLVKRQSQHLADQKALLETLKTSETFYDAQYREARIVANAYKNFGARINNMKKKLDELKKTMPKPESPIPSPDINAPSPENSPPTFGGPRSSFDYNASSSMIGYQGAGHQQNNLFDLPPDWNLNNKDSYGIHSNVMDNAHQDSPPLEAPSPEGSPTDLNLDGSENGNASLDSRLASFMDRNHRNSDSSQPMYMPTSSQQSLSSHSSKQQQHSSRLLSDEDGNTTPLDDEAPTTPVQDEHSTTPPKKNSPPKKENPIDFLSRLISQTQKTPTTKTGAASFLDSLTMLGNIGNKPTSTSLSSSSSLKTSESSDPLVSSQQQQVPPPPPPWSWNASTASVASQPSSPTIMSSQPSSPTTLFSRPPPTMVPPPPVPPIPIITPPVIPTQMSPPVNPATINLSVPPPPPPPFQLVHGTSIDFTSPPPPFQQTSPGQKENWPEKGPAGIITSDHSAVNRSSASSNSVLMELTPSKGFDEMSRSNPPPLSVQENKGMDPDAMEIVSDDEEELDALMKDSDSDMEHEALEEFASKLKEKTTNGSSDGIGGMKSSVMIPNANLVTVAVSDDMDEDERIVEKDSSLGDSIGSPSQWSSSKSHKKKSSRSRSRSRDRSSHKHKKKKKHKRKGSDDEYDYDGRSGAKKIGSRSSSRNSKDAKYDKDIKYDRYDDRISSKYEDKYSVGGSDPRGKYDRYEDKKYGSSSGSRSSSDYNKSSSYSGSARGDPRDPRSVEAYTQAFIQQYSQARFGSSSSFGGGGNSGDPRRSGYSKY